MDDGDHGTEAAHRDGLARRASRDRRRRLILASGYFDADWYRRHNPGAARSDLDAFDHYVACGIAGRADPGPLFDSVAYLRQAWHLRAGIDDPLAHYLEAGLGEGRQVVSVARDTVIDIERRSVEPMPSLSGTSRQPTLAVMVHVFYVELFDEICDALAMMPYRFTLLVTTDEPDKERRIREAFVARGLDAYLLVRVGPNRGRNFGPFLVEFREIVRAHELVVHLHTKRSLYSGTDRHGWRQAMLRTLLPARPVINGLIERFVVDERLGVLTASPGREMPYWSYSWLSNRHLARPLFERLGLEQPVPRGLFDYPVGGMFWARTSAICPLLDHPWRQADFPDELGQTDGTLMHAIERGIVLMAAEGGFGFAELDYECGLVRPGWSSRNLDQYRAATDHGLRATIDQVDTVSFDVFDTLLTRICLTPAAVHRYLAFMVQRRYPGATGYVAHRQAAEASARAARNQEGDVDLTEIHACLARDIGPGWSREAIGFVLAEEVALDMRTLRPRSIVIEALAHARRQGRRTILTSDSYLTRPVFETMLRRFGILDLVDEIHLSSERRARKDRGDLWRLVEGRERAGGARLLHVGDNEQSDIQRTADLGIAHFHVLPPAALLQMHGVGQRVLADGEHALGDEILLGPIAADLFGSPYLSDADHGSIRLDRPERAGGLVFGPPMVAFVCWAATHPAARHLGTLYFVSREGWFLKRLYDAMVEASGRDDLPKSVYFHCSRRTALAAAQGRAFDPSPVLRGDGYRGSVSDLLRSRLGFVPDAALGHHRTEIVLPRDDDLLRCLMALMQGPIEAHGRHMLRRFEAYARSVGMQGPGPHGLVDVGYSGTIQTAMQTAFGSRLIGFYMGTSPGVAQVRPGGGHAFGAFTDSDPSRFDSAHRLMLEAFLTAPHGQTIGYDDGVSPARPLFRHDGHAQTAFATLERMYAGVEQYGRALIECWGPELFDLPFRAEAATAMLEAVRLGRVRLGPELMRALSVEDDFCGVGEIPVLSRLPAMLERE